MAIQLAAQKTNPQGALFNLPPATGRNSLALREHGMAEGAESGSKRRRTIVKGMMLQLASDYRDRLRVALMDLTKIRAAERGFEIAEKIATKRGKASTEIALNSYNLPVRRVSAAERMLKIIAKYSYNPENILAASGELESQAGKILKQAIDEDWADKDEQAADIMKPAIALRYLMKMRKTLEGTGHSKGLKQLTAYYDALKKEKNDPHGALKMFLKDFELIAIKAR